MRKGTLKISTNRALHFLIIPASEHAHVKHPQRKVLEHKGPDPQLDLGACLALKARIKCFTAFEILYTNMSEKEEKKSIRAFLWSCLLGCISRKPYSLR